MPKIVDHEQRRAEIVRGLWSVIHERGIEGVTFQAVAQAAGVSVGRVQHYFASKDALVLYGCQAIVAGASDAYFARAALEDPWGALRELLVQPIPQTDAFRIAAAVWYAYLARAMVDPEIDEIVRDARGGVVEFAASLLEKAGLGSADSGHLEALRLVALSDGLSQRVLLGLTEPEDAVAVVDQELARLRS